LIYSVYGLKVKTRLPLNVFGYKNIGGRSYDIFVSCSSALEFKPNKRYVLDREVSKFYAENIALFTIKSGGEISYQYKENVSEVDIAQAFINFPIAAYLSQQGFFVLHASCVSKNDKTLLFIGKSHAGKSTLAYAFKKYGWEIITEDIAVIEPTTFEIKLSHPYVKLSLEARDYFNLHGKKSIKLNSDKREGHVFKRLLNKNKLITDVFVLGWGDKSQIKNLENKDAIKSLMDFSFSTSHEATANYIFKTITQKKTFHLEMKKEFDCLDKIVRIVSEKVF
tara:strand:- start:1248 stop:2087 length:840 start_codon:yes stop_codon:yes gene_type:complete